MKCRLDDEEFNLRAEKNKRKDNDDFLKKINSHEFQTGFIINLDDIMLVKNSDEEDLLNTIKDSSGRQINIKEKEYRDLVYEPKKQRFSLTSTNLASTNFSKQFDNLKSLDIEIKDLEQSEDEYNDLCSRLEIVQSEIECLTQKYKAVELLSQQKEIEEKLGNIKINKKLLEKKAEFDKLKEEFGGLNFLKQNEAKLRAELDLKENELKNCQDIENLDNYNLTSDDLKTAQNLVKEECDISHQIDIISKEIEDKKNKIEELKFEVKSQTNNLEIIDITDVDEYKNDKILLENYKNNYIDIREKSLNSENISNKETSWYNRMFFILFIGMFFVCSRLTITYWHTHFRLPSLMFLFISIAGISTTVMENISRKRSLKQNGYTKTLKVNFAEIQKLCKKYDYDISKDDNFIVKLSAFIQQMGDKLSQYDVVEKELFKTRTELEKEKFDMEIKLKSLTDAEKVLAEFNDKKTEFLEKIELKNLADFSDFYVEINKQKGLNKEVFELKEKIKIIEKNTENFIKNYNKFLEETSLDNFSGLNKYDYSEAENHLIKIREILDENISKNRLIDELNEQIENIDSELKNHPSEDIKNLEDVDDFQIIYDELQSKKEEKISILQKKNELEKVSNLLDLKNKKMALLADIKNGLHSLIKKEMVYNIIKKSKEKFNSIQPNLIGAKKYFSLITGGKYSEIDFEKMVISGDNFGEKPWTELSRGTKEQLYLALRLGYADNYTKDINNEPNGMYNLPLIIDDAFVNFDPERTKYILKCLADFSKTNQVLFFTCHSESVKDLLKTEKIKYNLIEL